MYIGKIERFANSFEVGYGYKKAADSNENAAMLLIKNAFYNEAAYLLIQAMEKSIKYYIVKKINIENEYFSNMLRNIGHSVDKAADLLVEIYSGGNKTLANQIKSNLNSYVFMDVRFSSLHNKLRYPEYNMKKGTYEIVNAGKEDCKNLIDMLSALKRYLEDLEKLL